MTTIDTGLTDIADVSEISSEATYSSIIGVINDQSQEVRIEDLVELTDDEEDIREGLSALADEEGTITWEQYQENRKK